MPNGTVEEWEADWRRSVDSRLSGLDLKLDTLIESVANLGTRLTVNETAVNDLRQAPAERREWLIFLAIAAGTLVSVLCGGSGLLVSIVGILLTHH